MSDDRVHNAPFLCTGHSARSILAEAAPNRLGQRRFRGRSAGSQPMGDVHSFTRQLVESLNDDISLSPFKHWEELAVPDALRMDLAG